MVSISNPELVQTWNLCLRYIFDEQQPIDIIRIHPEVHHQLLQPAHIKMKTENKAAKSEISQVLSKVLSEYQKNKSKKLLMVDGLIVYALATAIVQVIATEIKL